ncbi:hypothetical protein QN277_028173 [Acacia crassicarpa]|uniref:Uncharacterized protein n=1 Tax=Acacia crassicarpa TaxID=499986 RepID=A0AAE1J2Q5_9FABA|nr:hypothetical protein QN277_028173 [Acacia crassicarpa]
MNQAFGCKLAWNLVSGASSLWSDVLLHKYMLRNDQNLLTFKSGDSPLWRFISCQKDILDEATMWRVRNGNSVKFFSDKWLFKDELVEDMCLRSLSFEERASVVSDWTVNGSWDFQLLELIVPMRVIQRLIATPPL